MPTQLVTVVSRLIISRVVWNEKDGCTGASPKGSPSLKVSGDSRNAPFDVRSPFMMSDLVWFGSGIEDGTGERWFLLVVTLTEKEAPH